MPIIDMHAHISPDVYRDAIARGEKWHGLDRSAGELDKGGFNRSVPERLAEMDELGVDMQLITPSVGFYQYANELATTKAIARDCNEAVAQVVTEHPDRFAGLGTLPMQDVPSAIAELEYAVRELRMHGVVVSDHINGVTWDDPRFRPFFAAAQELGALLFFHQGGDTCVSTRINRYSLPNAVGNLTERTLTFSALVFGGVLDEYPDLKLLLAHGGGYTTFGAGRLDKVAGAFEGGDGLTPPFGRRPDDHVLAQPPSAYLKRFYYDCCTYSGPALRFIIDTVGIDRVVLGTDYPAPMVLLDAVNWVNGLDCLTAAEKQAILNDNPTRMLGL